MTDMYETDSARLYQELQRAMLLIPDYRKVYRSMNRVFLQCLDQQTAFSGIRFGGPFAKTDYLLREHRADRHLHRMVNDARVRFRHCAQMEERELQTVCLYDLKALCLFIRLLFGTPVPSLLEARFPIDERKHTLPPLADYWRVIVERFDEHFLYVKADCEGAEELCVSLDKNTCSPYGWDWNYLRSDVVKGSQLNLIHPRVKDGVVYPELVIFEPDYLVDISSVAACFEDFATTPLLHLLNKLKPATCSSAIMMGHLASQFLDEELCLSSEENTYAKSVGAFFQNHALALLATPLDSDFHQRAQAQKNNIRHAIRDGLAAHVSSFRPQDVILEPSFFSEMLGLQGRMDFLQLDQKILIEQKSGKGAYPQPDPKTPVAQVKHYVQMLLYSLLLRYNYREQYERNNFNLSAFLLYSRYENGLIAQGYAPQLVYQALQVRNGLVANEYRFSRGDISLLATLTSEMLNQNHCSGTLWNVYQRPQLERLLQPVASASSLERAYYLRFLTFVETEHLLAKVGTQTKENSGFADKWYSALEEKQQAGNIFAGLQMLSPSAADAGRVGQLVLLMPHRDDNEVSNFRKGDIVVLYPYEAGAEPDIRRSMVFRCTIEELAADRLTLSLRTQQTDAHVFWHQKDCLWALEHDFFESSFGSLYRGLHAFLSAPQERRDLLLFQRLPRVDTSLSLQGDYGSFNDLALHVRQARDLFLIIGPPGTGKTSFGLLTTLQEELLVPASKVLLMAYTNRAVDEICGKLVEQGIDFVRVGGRYACEKAWQPYLLDNRMHGCANLDALRRVILSTRVFVGTVTAFSSNTALFQVCRFSLAVIDEASQILEPQLMSLWSATTPDGRSAIDRFVLIGDHKQLPAVVLQDGSDSCVDDESLRRIHLTDCRLSLFERLLKQYRDNPQVVYMLTRQGRMHHDIAAFPNAAFYQGLLCEVPCAHQLVSLSRHTEAVHGIDRLLQTHRIAFVSIASPTDSVSDKVNTNEADAIAATVYRIYLSQGDRFSPLETVGVIVPYRNQIAAVRQAVARYGVPALRDITVDTVERFQGSQRDYILYGFTVQQHYQLRFLTENAFEEDGALIDRKLNVAMTRAREHLLLFGNSSLLTADAVFRQLITYTRQNGSYVEVLLSDYVNGSFSPPFALFSK